jgi:hypothetical protein
VHYTVRKAAFASRSGAPAWSVYANNCYTGMGIVRSYYRHGGRFTYTLQQDGITIKTFKLLNAARAWLNQSELERIVAAIEG